MSPTFCKFYSIPLFFLISKCLVIFQPYIRLVYEPTYSIDKTMEVFRRETNREVGNESVEGIMFSKETAVVMTGTFVDKVGDDGEYNPIGRWYKPWFYRVTLPTSFSS